MFYVKNAPTVCSAELISDLPMCTPQINNPTSPTEAESKAPEPPPRFRPKKAENYQIDEKASFVADSSSELSSLSHASQSSEPTQGIQVERKYSKKLSEPRTKLCGYLNKYSSKGIITMCKRRWFIFSESSCKLYYFRCPEDINPMGEIDIFLATFQFEVNNKEKPGLFTINHPDKSITLGAKDRQESLYWLQELQNYRRAYSQNLLLSQNICPLQVKKYSSRPMSGLLSDSDNQPSSPLNTIAPEQIILPSPDDQPSSPHPRSHSVRFAYQPKQSKSDEGWEILPEPQVSITDSPEAPKQMGGIRKMLRDSFRITEHGKSASEDKICSKCKKNLSTISTLQDELQTAEDEVLTSREVIKVLQNQLDFISKEKELMKSFLVTEMPLAIEDLSNSMTNLHKGEEEEEDSSCQIQVPENPIEVGKTQEISQTDEVVKVQNDLEEFLGKDVSDTSSLKTSFSEKIVEQVIELEHELEKVKGMIRVYEELVLEKDKNIMNLTNRVYDLENSDNESVKTSQSMAEEDLKDALHAYEVQNKFLNKEIVELNILRKNDDEFNKKLQMESSDWEAKYCQTQSKLLHLLQTLDKPFSGEKALLHDLAEEKIE